MPNIYDGCVSNSEILYPQKGINWSDLLDAKRAECEKQGYKVVFVFEANSFMNMARVVLYDKETMIPLAMQQYGSKYVKINGRWAIENHLGICDKCGAYEELVCLCRDGSLCRNCSEEDNEI